MWSLRILSEKNVANICDEDSCEVTDGRWETGLRSSRLLMEFQSLQGLEAEVKIGEEF